jgi:hypothetical protein
MKLHKSITFLLLVVGCIVVFWLYPSINKAGNTTYMRIYENTDEPVLKMAPASFPVDTPKVASSKRKTVYRKEEINPRAGVGKIKKEMFSRAIHFEEKIFVDSLEASTYADDSVRQIQ